MKDSFKSLTNIVLIAVGVIIAVPAIWAAFSSSQLKPLECDMDYLRSQRDAGKLYEVQIQVCMPTTKIRYRDVNLDNVFNHYPFTQYNYEQLILVPRSVRELIGVGTEEVGSADNKEAYYTTALLNVNHTCGIKNIAIDHLRLAGITVSDQPVYETSYGSAQHQYIAIGVAGKDVPGMHWFKLPEKIDRGKFSKWLSPTYSEPSTSGQTQFVLLNGGSVPAHSVTPNAPKIRVQLHNFSNLM